MKKNVGFFEYSCGSGFWWVRIFGYGIRFLDHQYHFPVSPESNNSRPCLHVGSWCFRVLMPGAQPLGN